MFGAAENTAFGAEVETALTQRQAGNLGPELLRLETSGTRLKLIYNETLDADSVPPADAFTVVVNPGYRAADVVGVEVSGSEVVVTLAQEVGSDDRVGLTYEVPASGAIRDVDGLAANGVTWASTETVPPPPAAPSVTGTGGHGTGGALGGTDRQRRGGDHRLRRAIPAARCGLLDAVDISRDCYEHGHYRLAGGHDLRRAGAGGERQGAWPVVVLRDGDDLGEPTTTATTAATATAATTAATAATTATWRAERARGLLSG